MQKKTPRPRTSPKKSSKSKTATVKPEPVKTEDVLIKLDVTLNLGGTTTKFAVPIHLPMALNSSLIPDLETNVDAALARQVLMPIRACLRGVLLERTPKPEVPDVELNMPQNLEVYSDTIPVAPLEIIDG